MTQYKIIIYWSKEDNRFIAEIPDCQDAWLTANHTQRRSLMQKYILMNGLKLCGFFEEMFPSQRETDVCLTTQRKT